VDQRIITTCPTCGKRNRVPAAARGRPRCAACKADLPWIVDADDATFPQVAEAAPLPVLVDLWAPWCGPCRQVSPVVERLGGELAGRLKVVKVDVDGSPRTAERFGARSIPTLLLLRDGVERDRQVGAHPEPALRQWLTRHLA
jgi:thioredoxin 2